MDKPNFVSVRGQAKRAYDAVAHRARKQLKAQSVEKPEADHAWMLRTFGRPLEDFTREGIEARVDWHDDSLTRSIARGLQIKDSETGEWSVPITDWAELGEQLDPDTFTEAKLYDFPDTTDFPAPTSTWADDLLDAIERGLIERGRL